MFASAMPRAWLALVVFAAILVSAPGVVRASLAAALVLFAPGYAATKVVFPARRLNLEGVCFSVGFSLAIAILCGFLLNAVAMMTAIGWALSLGGVTLILIAFGGLTAAEKRNAPPTMSGGQTLSVAFASVVAALAMAYAAADYQAHKEFSYTELWMAPAPHGEHVYVVGVRNREQTLTRYDLEIVSGAELIGSWGQIELADGESWTRTIQLKFDRNATREQRAEARLRKREDPSAALQRVWASIAPVAAVNATAGAAPIDSPATETP